MTPVYLLFSHDGQGQPSRQVEIPSAFWLELIKINAENDRLWLVVG
jgi:hypothetical protein